MLPPAQTGHAAATGGLAPAPGPKLSSLQQLCTARLSPSQNCKGKVTSSSNCSSREEAGKRRLQKGVGGGGGGKQVIGGGNRCQGVQALQRGEGISESQIHWGQLGDRASGK